MFLTSCSHLLNMCLLAAVVSGCPKSPPPMGGVLATVGFVGDADRAQKVARARIEALFSAEKLQLSSLDVELVGDDDRLHLSIGLNLDATCAGMDAIRDKIEATLSRVGVMGFHRCAGAEAVAAVEAALREALPGVRVQIDGGSVGGIDVWPAAGVDPVAALGKAASGLPDGVRVLTESVDDEEDPGRQRLWVVIATPSIDGSAIANARASFDERNQPIVMLDLDPDGAQAFADLTARMVNDTLAIVVDDAVLMAPRVEEKIPGGRVRITLGTLTAQAGIVEAHMLALALRTGPIARRVDVRRVEAVCLPSGP